MQFANNRGDAGELGQICVQRRSQGGGERDRAMLQTPKRGPTCLFPFPPPNTTLALLTRRAFWARRAQKAYLSKLAHDNALFDPSQAQTEKLVCPSLGSFDLKGPSFGQRGPCVDREILFRLKRALYRFEGRSPFDLIGPFSV